MTEEIMQREDRMGKMLTLIGGCLAGVLGVFAVAVMSELSTSAESEEDGPQAVVHDEEIETL